MVVMQHTIKIKGKKKDCLNAIEHLAQLSNEVEKHQNVIISW